MTVLRQLVGGIAAFAAFALPAAAAPGGVPVIEESSGTLRVAVAGQADQVPEADQQCDPDDDGADCEGLWRRSLLLAEGQVTLLRGVALFGEVGRVTDRLPEANYRGVGPAWGLGLRLSTPLPVDQLHLAAELHFSWAWSEGGSLDSGGVESAWAHVHEGRVVAAWGNAAEGLLVYGGAETSLYWDHSVQPLGYDGANPVVELPMKPRQHVTGVAGMALTSRSLGAEWNRSARLTTGVHGRVGQVRGVGAFVGAVY